MAALGKYLRTLEGGLLAFWCPGCDEGHHVRVEGEGKPLWGYNGKPEAPTFSPSVLVTGVQCRRQHKVEAGGKTVCHSFVREGQIQFLGDCTHGLAGQTVPLPEFPA